MNQAYGLRSALSLWRVQLMAAETDITVGPQAGLQKLPGPLAADL